MSDVQSLFADRPAAATTPDPGMAAAIVEAADAPLCVGDEAGCCIAVNQAAAALLGVDRGEILGRPFGALLETAGAVRAVMRRTLLTDGRTVTVATLRPEAADRDPAPEADALRARLAPSVRAMGNFAEIFRSRTFGPLGHARYDDFASAITEAARAMERAMTEPVGGAPAPSLPSLLDERPWSLRGIVTSALRRGRHDMSVDVAGDDMSVRCDQALVGRAVDAMIGADRGARIGMVRATLSRLVDGRTVIGIHHCDDGYPLGWARMAGSLPLGDGDGDRAAEIDVADARRIFEAHGGGVFVNTEDDAGISVFGVLGPGRLTGTTARRPSPGTDIRRAIYVDAKMAPAAFAALPTGALRLDAAGGVVAHVVDRLAHGGWDAVVGRAVDEGPLRRIWSDGLRRMVRGAAEDGTRGLHEATVEVGDRLRILHLEIVPARLRPGQCWLFLRAV